MSVRTVDAFTDEVIDLIASEPKIAKYVDMPLQHGDGRHLVLGATVYTLSTRASAVSSR